MRVPAFARRRAAAAGVLVLPRLGFALLAATAVDAAADLDFNRDVRPILSQNCFFCHGPDAEERKGGRRNSGGLRLDTAAGQQEDLGGYAAVKPGDPGASEMIRRLVTTDPDDLMPPPGSGKRLTPAEVDVLRRWIAEGARFSGHWAYERPVRPLLPPVRNLGWVRNEVDRFILARLEAEGLCPQPEADRYALARRLALDLTGVPPTLREVDAFVGDPAEDAYERYVDRLLAKEAYGERWAGMWLDLARYADSAGYADDPPRTIWLYRDYVIRAFNRNLPFDQFTLEQLAGDLLNNPTEDQLIATAFHRNTMTNSEGGTSDEEFRNVAVVDRVNTTFAVWMGTSMACAQCHTHKYDPISQTEYFQLFAFLNNTADADRPDESPLLEIYPPEVQAKRDDLEREFAALDRVFSSPTPALREAAEHWARVFPATIAWTTPRPATATAASGTSLTILDDHSVLAAGSGEGRFEDTYTVEVPFDTAEDLTALRLEALAHESLERQGPGLGGNFLVRRVEASVLPVPNQAGPPTRVLRLEAAGPGWLPLAEIEVFSQGRNIAALGRARFGSTTAEAAAARTIDGTPETAPETAPPTGSAAAGDRSFWELELPSAQPVERIVVHATAGAGKAFEGFRLQALDDERRPVWEADHPPVPDPRATFELTGPRPVTFVTAAADLNQGGFNEAFVATDKPSPPAPGARQASGGDKGWAIGDATGKDHALILIAAPGTRIPRGATLRVTLRQSSAYEKQTLGRFRLGVTTDPRIREHAETPAVVVAALQTEASARDATQRGIVLDHFVRYIAPGLESERERLAELKRQREAIKPWTVPILRELNGDQRRLTKVQLRGNFLATGDEVSEGVPAVWHPLPPGSPRNRLTLARWLVSEENPLTARVVANRFWEQLFGIGLVRTSEEFGSQGELPVNPALLDWLAVEFRDAGWDVKHLLRLLVTSAAYRQSSRVTPDALEKDPENRLLSRGPRFRLAAEAVRDQALAAGGLLSPKLHGPSVRPPRPNLGLRAAFGGHLDWQTSPGEDRHRRALYTEWRRTSPYPSMVTFDAPNREVCTLRRPRSNTPLQALVTLNDPVYLEAARGLARRMTDAGPADADRVHHGFRLVLARPPATDEIAELTALKAEVRAVFAADPSRARAFAGTAETSAPTGEEVVDLAAWTAVANVLLNLDETLMKR